jgi:putative transposase
MARRLRVLAANSVVHVVNRGNERRRIFDRPENFEEFVDLLDWTLERRPTRMLAWALMPNHWHLVLWPATATELSKFLHLLTTSHAARFRYATATVGLGHVYQGRYHSTVVEDDDQYVRTLRYVEANPARANLVPRAEEWPWTSLRERLQSRRLIVDGPVGLPQPADWVELVNAPEATGSPRSLASP